MKQKLQTLLKHKLQWLVLLLALFGVSQGVWGYNIAKDSKIYFVNTDAWTEVNMWFWGDGWTDNQTMTHITNTGIYYKKFDNQYDYGGWIFRNASGGGGSYAGFNVQYSVSGNMWYKYNSSTKQTTMAGLNGTAKLNSMISTDGSSYSKTYNSNCVATISGYNLGGGNSSTTDVSASTGSSATATIYPAYASTVTYSGSNGTGFRYLGISTTEKTNGVPSDVASSPTAQSLYCSSCGNTNLADRYAYFIATYSVTASKCTATSAGGSVKLDDKASPLTKTVDAGTSVKFTAVPTNSAWEFEGWYSDAGGSTLVSTSNPYNVTITSAKTLYAKFNNVCGTVNVTNPDGTNYSSCPGGKTLSVSGSNGTGTLSYQWYRTTAATATGGTVVTEKLTAAEGGNYYTPNYNDAGTAYRYYCIARSSGDCESYKSATSGVSGVFNTNTSVLKISPSISLVKSYEPVTLTATNANVESWSLSPTEGPTQYLYDSSKRRVKFKGVGDTPAITYTITATARDGLFTCPGKATVIVEEDEDCE